MLLDLQRVVPCLPGASIESGVNGEFIGRVKVKLGPIEMTYRGTVRVAKRDDATHEAILNAAAKEIKGGGAASAVITLRGASASPGTDVTVLSDFTVSGKAAQFGRGVIDEVGAKLIAEFADRMAALMSQIRAAQGVVAVEPSGVSPGITEATHTAPTAAVAPDDPQPDSARGTNDALDVFKLAWWPMARRLLIPAVVVGVVVVALWLLISSRHG